MKSRGDIRLGLEAAMRARAPALSRKQSGG